MISAILGSEYCSGYIDSVGKWNTGFYCPSSSDLNGDGGDVFCCGTEHHKYCCTSTPQDTVQVEQVNNKWGTMMNIVFWVNCHWIVLTKIFLQIRPWTISIWENNKGLYRGTKLWKFWLLSNPLLRAKVWWKVSFQS